VIRAFAGVCVRLEERPGVTRGRMFGSEGLRLGGRVFAMEVKGRLVVKLSLDRAAELVKLRKAEPFDPGHGRPMRQWVSVSPRARLDWVTLAEEALAFARG